VARQGRKLEALPATAAEEEPSMKAAQAWLISTYPH